MAEDAVTHEVMVDEDGDVAEAISISSPTQIRQITDAFIGHVPVMHGSPDDPPEEVEDMGEWPCLVVQSRLAVERLYEEDSSIRSDVYIVMPDDVVKLVRTGIQALVRNDELAGTILDVITMMAKAGVEGIEIVDHRTDPENDDL